MRIDINGSTRLLGLLGHPIEHSRSPFIHNSFASDLGLPFAYLAFDARPEELKEKVDSLIKLGCRGFNLTMPLKRDIIPLLDEISDVSKICNAVNTVIIEDDGTLRGDTTDGLGLLQSVRSEGVRTSGKRMTILGAGGAASAIAASAAYDDLSEIVLCKRNNGTFGEAVSFANRLGEASGSNVRVCDMSDENALEKCIFDTDILVNATNVGMGKDDRTPIRSELLHKDLFVCDIVYDPLETRLMKEAEKIGARTVNGLGMLLYQAAVSFELWTGVKPDAEKLKEELISV